CPISPSDAPAPIHSFHGSGTSLTRYAIASAAGHFARSTGADSEPAAMRSMKHSSRLVISYEASGALIVALVKLIVPFQAAGRGDTGAWTRSSAGSGETGKPQPLDRPSIMPRALIRAPFPASTICSSAASGAQPR